MLRHYKKYKKRYQNLYILYVVLTVLIQFLNFAEIILVGGILDNLIKYQSMKMLYRNCICWFTIFLSDFIIGLLSGYINTHLDTKISYDIKADLIEKIYNTPILRWSDWDKVEMSQRLDLDSKIICSYILNIPVSNLMNVASVITIFVVLAIINGKMLVAVAVIVLIYLGLYAKTRILMGEAYEKFQKVEAVFYARMNEQIQMMNFMKLHNVREWFDKRFQTSFGEYYTGRMWLQKITMLFSSCDSLVDVCMQILVYLLAGKGIIDGTIQPGMFVVTLGFYSTAMGNVKYFYHLGEIIQNTKSADKRISEILSCEEEQYGNKTSDSIWEIEFENVNFAFGDKKIIQQFNYKFVTGKIYGLVGANGIGKSTLINLLTNMYQYQGEIRYNGMNSREFDIPFLRKNIFGVTEQTSALVPGTIYDNVVFSGKENRAQTLELSSVLGMDSVIEKFPKRWNTRVNENGSNLSGGEKKLITVMRELMKTPGVLILDEPTNELDKEKKEKLMTFLIKNKKDKITIIISHDKEIEDYYDDVIMIGDKNEGKEKKLCLI